MKLLNNRLKIYIILLPAIVLIAASCNAKKTSQNIPNVSGTQTQNQKIADTTIVNKQNNNTDSQANIVPSKQVNNPVKQNNKPANTKLVVPTPTPIVIPTPVPAPSVDPTPTPTPAPVASPDLTTGRLAISTTASQGWSSILVTINGQFTGTLTKYFEPGNPASCDSAVGARVVAVVPVGNVSYSAVSESGSTWSGSAQVSPNGCFEITLTCQNRNCSATPLPPPTPIVLPPPPPVVDSADSQLHNLCMNVDSDYRKEISSSGGMATESQIEAGVIARMTGMGCFNLPPPYQVPRAICSDWTYSYSQNNPGTCSDHGGVASWYPY